MSDLIPSPNSKSPTGLTSSGSKKTKSKLSGQYSPTSSLSSQSPTQKSKHTRNNSSKISSFSFQAQMADSAGDGMFELLSVPIDNKTLMQYVKTSLKKDGSVSSPKKSSQEVISSTQSIVIPKSEAEKMKAAVLLAQKLQVLLRKSFKAFATAVEANNRQIYKKPNNQAKVLIKNMKNLNLTSSEIARNLEALDKDSGSNLNTPNTQYFPEMKSIGYLPSFPVSTLNSSHLMNEEVKENNGVPRTYSTDLINKNKEAIAQNNSIYSVHDANAPGEKLPLQIDATSEIYPSNSNVEDANEVEGQESSSNNRIYTVPESQPVQETQHSGQKLKNMMTPAPKFLFDKSGTEQKKKESFRSNDSLMSNDYDNQYPAAKLSNSQFGQFKLNQSMDLIRYKSDTTDAQFPRGNFVSLGSAEKLSSVYRADSQTSVSNDIFFKSLSVLGSSPKLNYVREDDRFYDGLISGALPQKTRALYRLAYIFYKTSGMYDMFKIMKDTARMYLSSPKSSSMRSYETPKSQTILFPNYSYFPQSANLGFALNLDKILETDSRDMTSKGRDGTSQRVVMAHTPSYSYEILRMQHKMKALLILEKVCANLVRKVYRTSFADLNSIKDCSLYIDHENQTVQINEGNIATSRDLSQLISNTSRFNKDDKSSTERKSLKQEYYSELFDGRSKLKNIVDPKNKNQPKIEQKAVQHQEREIERGHVVETSFLTPRETIHTQVNTERVRLANQAPKVEIKDYNESALEERLERSLEKKLESKLNQNLDEKLRGKLQKELLKLLGKDLNIGSSRRQNSQDMGIQTDGPIQTSSLHYLDKPVYGKKLNVSIEDMYHNKTLPGHLNQVPSQDSKFPYYYANANSMPRYSGEERYYNKAYHKFFDSSSGIKEFSAIGRPEDNMMFSCESPIRDVTILDHSESKLDEIFNYSPRGNGASSRVIDEAKPTRLTPQRYGARTTTPNDYLHPNFDVNRSTSNLPLNRVEDKFRSHPHFVHGSSAMASQVQSIAFLERALMRKVNQGRYEAFEQLKKLVPQAQSGNGHRIMNFLEANYMKAQAQNLVRASPGHARGHSFNQGYTNQGYMNQVQTNMTNYLYSSLQQPQTFGRAENPGHKQRLSETFENMNERFAVAPKQKYTMSKNETLVFVLQKLTLRRLKTAFNKFQRPIVTQNLRSYQKKSTLNYLLFAKKVEKVYISKLRTSFTRLCLKNSVNSNNKGLKLAKFFQNNQLKQKKTFFNKLRAISTRHLNVQNSLGKLFSLLNQKKLRSLSEAFFLTASYSLVKKEYMLNLTLITMQLSELKKAKLRSAFLALKQHTSRGNDRKRDKKQVLKNVLHETKLRWYFAMKHAFLRWKGTASNLSTTKLNESRIVDRDRAVKLHMATLLRNLFSSEMKMEKFQAFYKIKHHTRNSKGALALYNVLSKKVWNRQRFGLENIMKTKRDSDSSSEDEVQIRLENLAEIVKDRLHAGLMKIYMYSQGMRSPTARIDVKKGLLRLCVISEDIKQKFLLHGLKMLELYNIHKRNQKALYVNLGLKLWLLFEEKEKSLKKDFFSILSLNFEKEDYQQKVLEKLLRRTHTKNLAYFFNKYKSEIVNVKLNDSIVNLAIKNIILAVEKVSKVQRARMGLVLRKLALATLGKQPEVENSIVVAQQTSTLFKLREIGSVESIGMVSPKISQEDNKLRNTRLSQVIEKMREIRLHHAFKKLRSNLRASKLIERLSDVDSEIFKKVIYKRIFFGFAQIKYIVEKRQQKMVAQKLFKLQSVIQKFDKSLPRSVEDGFRKWAATVKSDSQHLAKSLEVLAKQKKVKFFGKWKKAMKNREQRTEKFVAILAKIEKSSEKKLAKLVKLAFTRIMKSKQLEITLPSNRSMLELAPPTPSKKKKVTKAKSPQARTIDKKLNLNFDKRVTSGGSLIMTEKSPTNSVKKSTARSIEEGMVVSPASRFSKAANMAGAKDASPTSLTISSQPSSKMSTPIHAPKTKKKGKDKNF